MHDLTIFSYLPNPRIWKSTIAATFNGVKINVVGATPPELGDWLWDLEPRPMDEADRTPDSPHVRQPRKGFGKPLYKTDAFLDRVPFGTVPCAFSPDGAVGLFESNSILRAVARLGEATRPLYGADPYEASRIDSFLDVTLVMAKDSQTYLLALNSGRVDEAVHAQMVTSFDDYLAGLEQALASGREYLVGDSLSIADICFACEICQISREKANIDKLQAIGLDLVVNAAMRETYPKSFAHFDRLRALPEFAAEMDPFFAKLDARAAKVAQSA